MMDIFRACFPCKKTGTIFNTNSKKYFTIRLKKIIIKEGDNFQQS